MEATELIFLGGCDEDWHWVPRNALEEYLRGGKSVSGIYPGLWGFTERKKANMHAQLWFHNFILILIPIIESAGEIPKKLF
jgi:hypothetical protein